MTIESGQQLLHYRLTEIGKFLDVSRERVRQIEMKALSKLRSAAVIGE